MFVLFLHMFVFMFAQLTYKVSDAGFNCYSEREEQMKCVSSFLPSPTLCIVLLPPPTSEAEDV